MYITPTLKEVNELIQAGADIIAFDATLRKRENTIEEMISAIHNSKKLFPSGNLRHQQNSLLDSKTSYGKKIKYAIKNKYNLRDSNQVEQKENQTFTNSAMH